MSKNNISFILHKPQLSENIGACARAMKNFNFSKLIVINPKPTFPNDKIIATSVGADEIIKKSKVYETLEPAMKPKFGILNCCCTIALPNIFSTLSGSNKPSRANFISSTTLYITL